jgi:hypothetical protein
MMMHKVEFDADKVTSTYLKDVDGRDKSAKSYVARARDLAARLTSFLAERNEQQRGLESVGPPAPNTARPLVARRSTVDAFVMHL